MSEELKPCPFCGGIPKTSHRPESKAAGGGGNVAFVVCYCGGYASTAHQMGHAETVQAAIAEVVEKWNTRAQLPSPWGEAVEVVGWRVEFPLNNGAKVYDQRQEWAYQEYGDVSYHVDELMTVDQHYRILAAQRTKTCIALKERNDAKAVAQHQRIMACAPQHDAELVELLREVRRRVPLPDWARARIDAKLATLSAKP